jgi:AraC family ethanolamine operon transcriptional activator
MVHLTLFRPELLTSPIAAKRFEDEVASQLVSSVVFPAGYEVRGVRHRAARRALDYIRANADEMLTISDLCREIGASQRTLEIGFQELYGMPPKAYLTKLRLRRARRDLLQADRARDSVTDIATRWGFFHFGRFARAYCKQYGELPNATINRVS